MSYGPLLERAVHELMMMDVVYLIDGLGHTKTLTAEAYCMLDQSDLEGWDARITRHGAEALAGQRRMRS